MYRSLLLVAVIVSAYAGIATSCESDRRMSFKAPPTAEQQDREYRAKGGKIVDDIDDSASGTRDTESR